VDIQDIYSLLSSIHGRSASQRHEHFKRHLQLRNRIDQFRKIDENVDFMHSLDFRDVRIFKRLLRTQIDDRSPTHWLNRRRV